MKTIAIVVGHGPVKDRGAVNKNGTTELDWNRDLAIRIARAVGSRAKTTIVHRTVERRSPVAAVNATKADVAVELHLNAYNKVATGTEMLYWNPSRKAKVLADVLQVAAVGVLGLKDRGLKPINTGENGAPFLRDTQMPAVIVESFFIDNSSDLFRGNARKSVLASAYADALLHFLS